MSGPPGMNHPCPAQGFPGRARRRVRGFRKPQQPALFRSARDAKAFADTVCQLGGAVDSNPSVMTFPGMPQRGVEWQKSVSVGRRCRAILKAVHRKLGPPRIRPRKRYICHGFTMGAGNGLVPHRRRRMWKNVAGTVRRRPLPAKAPASKGAPVGYGRGATDIARI